MDKVTLQDVLLTALESRVSKMHTALPGKIEKYDYETQKASVKPLIKKAYLDKKIESLPVIVNVPVIFPRSKDFSFTYPLNEGDLVLLVFSERSLELYLKDGGEQEPGDRRKFDLSDAIAIPGLYPFSEESKAQNNTDVLVKFKEAEFKIKPDGKFYIKGDMVVTGEITATVDVKAAGKSLKTHVHSGVTPGPGNSGPPV